MQQTVVKLNDLTLKQIQEYYVENILGKIFRFTLRPHRSKNELEIEIKFFEDTLPHLLGIQKVVPKYMKASYQGQSGYDKIKDGTITIDTLRRFDDLRKREDKVLPKIESRLTHFFLLEELLLNCNMVKFNNIEGKSQLRSELILYHDALNVRLHLGVLKEQSDKDLYVAETFFVNKLRRNQRMYTSCPPNQYINVIKRQVIYT